MARQNDRLIGLSYLVPGGSKHVISESSYGLADNYVVSINVRNNDLKHEKLENILNYIDPDQDPMLIQLSDFQYAKSRYEKAFKELSQLVCDNKDFDFSENIHDFNNVIVMTAVLTEKISEVTNQYKKEMLESLSDNPPQINILNDHNDIPVGVTVSGNGLYKRINVIIPRECSKEFILSQVIKTKDKEVIHALRSAGQVIVEGKILDVPKAYPKEEFVMKP